MRMIALMMIGCLGLPAAEVVAEWDWAELIAQPPPGVELRDELLVVSVGERGAELPLATIDLPADLGPRYRLDLRVRHADLAARAYLEQWNDLDDGTAFFTRTLAQIGPMAALTGSSDGWRRVSLPADASGGTAAPERIRLALHAAGSGRIELGPPRLIALSPEDHLLQPVAASTGAPPASPATAAPGGVSSQVAVSTLFIPFWMIVAAAIAALAVIAVVVSVFVLGGSRSGRPAEAELERMRAMDRRR